MSDTQLPHDEHSTADPQHESLALQGRPILIGVAGLILLLLASMVAMFALERLVGRDPVESAGAGESSSQLPTIGLNPNQRADLLAMQAAQTQWLQAYAWVDESQGIVRISIEQAMERIATQISFDMPTDRDSQEELESESVSNAAAEENEQESNTSLPTGLPPEPSDNTSQEDSP